MQREEGRRKGQGRVGRPDSRRALQFVHKRHVLPGLSSHSGALLPCTALERVCMHSVMFVMRLPSVRMQLDSGGHWNCLYSPRHTLTTIAPRRSVLPWQPCSKGLRELRVRGKNQLLINSPTPSSRIFFLAPPMHSASVLSLEPWEVPLFPAQQCCPPTPCSLHSHSLGSAFISSLLMKSAPAPQLRLQPYAPSIPGLPSGAPHFSLLFITCYLGTCCVVCL